MKLQEEIAYCLDLLNHLGKLRSEIFKISYKINFYGISISDHARIYAVQVPVVWGLAELYPRYSCLLIRKVRIELLESRASSSEEDQ